MQIPKFSNVFMLSILIQIIQEIDYYIAGKQFNQHSKRNK